MEIVIGIDLGTQGVRMLAVTSQGEITASAEWKFAAAAHVLPPGWVEQDPLEWWQATATCLRKLTASLPPGTHIAGIAIDATSGTVLPVDSAGEPLHPALMYNDARSSSQVAQVRQAAAGLEQRLGYAFNASFALPKLLWLMHERPAVYARTNLFIHATDFIAGRLTGDYGVTDYSDALKTGYDLAAQEWPAFIESQLGLPIGRLPRVVAPGHPLGLTHTTIGMETGLPAGVPVFGGATDGTAAQIASGAVEPGAWNTSLGTTLVIKGITEQLLRDPLQRIYSHRHPQGWWMPGGASNTGTEWIVHDHAGQDLQQLDAQAARLIPTALVRYPLARTGERFPFLHPKASGFTVDQADSLPTVDQADSLVYYAAGLEGTALLERLAYDTLSDIGATVGECISVTGGGSKSLVWMRIRASVLGRQLKRPACSETAMGAALLAASGAWFGTLSEAAHNMVKPDVIVDPDATLSAAYEQKYRVFCDELRRRGYLEDRTG
ncbi:MAG: FGGY-family carbohydrate kinase [Chloroflexi bacterium]|nr:FGGY-family carbohydrate kinase [Chloroflexota bacterium]